MSTPLALRIRRWLWPWRWLGALVLIVWGWSMSQLAQHKTLVGAKRLEKLFPWAVRDRLATGTEWMGIYLKGQKIGYNRNTTKSLPTGYAITQRSVMRMTMFGRKQQIRLLSRIEVNRQYQLKRFSFRLDSGLSLFRATGEVKGDKLAMVLYTGGAERKLSIAYKPALLAPVLRPYLAAKKPPPGQRISTWIFDPQTMSYARMLIVIERYETIVHQGRQVRVLRMRQHFRGMKLMAWIDDKGRVIKEFSPTGMMLLRESAEQAPRGIHDSFDVIRATRIVPRGGIRDATTRHSLLLRLEKVQLSSFPALHGLRQQLRGLFLAIEKQPWRGGLAKWPKVPLVVKGPGPQAAGTSPFQSQFQTQWPQAGTSRRQKLWQTPLRGSKVWLQQQQQRLLKQALASTSLVQSNHFEIQSKAHEITRGTTHRVEAIRALMDWIAASIKERSVAGMPSALDTLQKKVGDCNEHATLFAALARAVKIPCTITSGLAYRRGSFYFHAWNECHIQGRHWISVDTLWRQLPADTTHIAFVRGGLKDQSKLLQLLGKLQITVVE